jgi:Gpi18-like mannosyltransferase
MLHDSTMSPGSAATALPRRWWLEPTCFWLVHRVLFLCAIYAGAALLPARQHVGTENPQAGPVDLIPFYHDYARHPEKYTAMIGREVTGPWSWAAPLVRWDAWWLLGIAESGYTARPDGNGAHNVVFFPLFPLVVGGLRQLGIPVVIGALLVNAVAFLMALLVLYRLQWSRGGQSLARWTMAFWLAFPTSFYTVVPYTEALMALLTVLAMNSHLQQRYITTGLWAGIASALRPQGMLLGASLIDGWLRRKFVRPTLGMMLSGLGIAIYAGWLWWSFGDPFYFAELQKKWRPHVSFNPVGWITTLIGDTLAVLLIVTRRRTAYHLLSCRMIDPFLTWWAVLRLPSVRRLSWGWLLVACLMLAMPLSTGTILSMGRYIWAILPLFMVMADDYRTSNLRWPIAIAGGLVGLWLAFLFGGGWVVV